ncbi:type II toxin-antitoxin system VapC family toxin [candidate division KSB1 bacterium]|nr:type II toxin-antitoxin system VapC family toxin [candidate division KSB1 bacterium]
MNLLLDTHAFLWFIKDDASLSLRARGLIEEPENKRLLSIVSLWEIAIKASLGKIVLKLPFDALMPRQLQENDIDLLPIALPHLGLVERLPFHHRDPFDRLIIAQSLVENLPLVSIDSQFEIPLLQNFLRLYCQSSKTIYRSEKPNQTQSRRACPHRSRCGRNYPNRKCLPQTSRPTIFPPDSHRTRFHSNCAPVVPRCDPARWRRHRYSPSRRRPNPRPTCSSGCAGRYRPHKSRFAPGCPWQTPRCCHCPASATPRDPALRPAKHSAPTHIARDRES